MSNNIEWTKNFKEATKHIVSNCTYQQSSIWLRELIKTGLLKFTDMRDNPDRFFEAHRLLLAPKNGAGFGIRFTVQFNLFAGSILGLGNKKQLEQLDKIQKDGSLGCFCLTERMAGVNSGLVVDTTIHWIPEKQMFTLHSPNEGSYKNWISQGLTADKCVVVAKLFVSGKNLGPHAFVMDMRDSKGNLVKGVTVGDMGGKTTANDLDNAWVRFENVLLPKESMLSRFCEIREDKYVLTTSEKMRLEVIGQRLLTGRLAIAQAALVYAREIFDKTKSYSDKKRCWSPDPSDVPMLSDMPQLRAIYNAGYKQFNELDQFCAIVQSRLSKCLREETIPDADLVEAIAVAKIQSVRTSMDLVFALKKEVGSYALMAGTGFEHTDFFMCCAFAEGDGRILMQKLARDRVKSFQSQGFESIGKTIVTGSPIARAELELLLKLIKAMEKGKQNPLKTWNDNYEAVYTLADLICEKHFERAGVPARLQSRSKL